MSRALNERSGAATASGDLAAPSQGRKMARALGGVPMAVQAKFLSGQMSFEEQAELLKPPPLAAGGAPGVQMMRVTEGATPGTAVQMEGDEEAPTPEQAERIRKMAKMRDDYETEVRALRAEASAMLGNNSEEQVARHVSARRREIGEKYKDLTPADKREQIYKRNLQKYGDKLGPTPDYLHNEKGKSWADIIESSCTPGGEDIIPGLLAQGLGRPDLESTILSLRGGGASTWFDVISQVTKGK